MRSIKFLFMGAILVLVISMVAFPLAVSAKQPPPVPPSPPSPLTAKFSAVSGETFSQDIDATNYDIGIYIGPGVKNVKVKGITISGANQTES